ncbi:MAG: hypothetical protein LC792_27955, partial [Actinobacteria bacterium]|nr:hypothetical protein [Actinomycetota bacterium]
MSLNQSLFHVTSLFTWADEIWPGGFLRPKAETGRPGISRPEEERMWVSGVAYPKSSYVFLAPEHRRQRLARNYGGRSIAVLEIPIGVLDGRRWTAVGGREEQGGGPGSRRSKLALTSV